MHALQDATTLTPLDADAVAAGLASTRPGRAGGAGVPGEAARVVPASSHPPTGTGRCRKASLRSASRTPAPRRTATLRRTTGASLAAGSRRPSRRCTQALVSGRSPEVNGWKLTFHAFDYNLDFFEVGALDDDRFKIADPKLRIVERAAAAIGGLWGNHPYEAAYIMTYLDDRRRAAERRPAPTPCGCTRPRR